MKHLLIISYLINLFFINLYSQGTNNDNPFFINIGKKHYNTILNMNDILQDEQSYGLTDNHHLSRFSSFDVDWNSDVLNDIFMNFGGVPEIGAFSGLLIDIILVFFT